jgi:uncharacterized protein (TIGR02271 family)
MATKNTKRNKKDNTTSKIIGAGVGGAGGAAAGAAVGTAVMPGVGTAVGAVVGAVAGGAAGTAVGAYVNPAQEERYWEEHYPSRPYYDEGVEFAEYRPAYRYGLEAACRYPDKSFSEVEKRLSRNWPNYRGKASSLGWAKASEAVRDAHDRTLKLHEERLNVAKEPVTTGEVSVRKEVVKDRQKIDVPVEREEVVVTRRKAHGPASRSDIQPQAEEIRIPVKEEKVKVSKEAVVTEEVDVGRRKVRGVEHVDDTVRREELRVEKKGEAKVNQKASAQK